MCPQNQRRSFVSWVLPGRDSEIKQCAQALLRLKGNSPLVRSITNQAVLFCSLEGAPSSIATSSAFSQTMGLGQRCSRKCLTFYLCFNHGLHELAVPLTRLLLTVHLAYLIPHRKSLQVIAAQTSMFFIVVHLFLYIAVCALQIVGERGALLCVPCRLSEREEWVR